MLSKYLEDEKYYVIITVGKLLSMHLAKITTWAVGLHLNLKDFWHAHSKFSIFLFLPL